MSAGATTLTTDGRIGAGRHSMSEDEDLVGYAEIAEMVGVKVGTIRNYRSIGLLPEPDAPFSIPDRPRWRRSTIVAWQQNRRGMGAPGRPRRGRNQSAD